MNRIISVSTFYQENIGLWVIIAKDVTGEQIGELTYATDKQEAYLEVERITQKLKETQ